jgi:hypothetical protein
MAIRTSASAAVSRLDDDRGERLEIVLRPHLVARGSTGRVPS